MEEKKKLVLMTATKLLSTQGYQHTTMQNIAKFCGISKKSLYEFFDSKEKLFLSILQFNAQLVDDEKALIEQNKDLEDSEKFMSVLELFIKFDLQFYEFYKVNDMTSLGEGPIYEYARQRLLKNLDWFSGQLKRIHGAEIERYTNDCFILFKGMATEYMELSVKNIISIDEKELAHFLIRQVNIIAKQMLSEKYAPLLPMNLISGMDAHAVNEHPLVIIKKIEKEMSDIQVADRIKEEITDSIEILSKEIKRLEPQKAILAGMVRNMEVITELSPLLERLKMCLNLNQK